jgi:hypothetical protein
LSFVKKSVSEIQKLKNHRCWFVKKKIRIKELEGAVILKAQMNQMVFVEGLGKNHSFLCNSFNVFCFVENVNYLSKLVL